MAKTDSKRNTVAWEDHNWKQIQKTVSKLQRRIYQASVNGEVSKIHKLQKTLIRSHYAKLLAVRTITQDNQGKKTAGIDGIKSLSPKQRLSLVGQLTLKGQGKPVRRVFIPKSNGEKRPLGIPTIEDRAKQALTKMALEPEWEAKFEPNSYGFRPGRSCHDAIGAIHTAISKKAKYVLDADIAKCFDRINHNTLLNKINSFPTITRQIKAWLKAGAMERNELFPTNEGTPQGGVISPLLANIALHGMEQRIKGYAKTLKRSANGGKQEHALNLIRYADDFVIMHEELAVIEQCRTIIENFLTELDLELKPSKTRIAHTLSTHEGNQTGFNFLGFNIRQYPVGKHQSGKTPQGKPLGFKTIIKPAKEKVKTHYQKIAKTIGNLKAEKQKTLIIKLNPLIRGWTNYYASVCSKETYSKLDHLIFLKLKRWAFRRHPNKNRHWIVKKYWQSIDKQNWIFATREDKNPLRLQQYADKFIVRHVKVKGEKSPYDGDWIYWSTRLGKHPETPTRVSQLLKKQKGKCNHCGLHFQEGDKMEIDHIIPRSQGGKDEYKNLQMLHRHCHDHKTIHDDSLNGICDKNLNLEERGEGKLSRHVLKTSK